MAAELRAKQEAWGSLDLASCVDSVDVVEGESLNGRLTSVNRPVRFPA